MGIRETGFLNLGQFREGSWKAQPDQLSFRKHGQRESQRGPFKGSFGYLRNEIEI